jgi:hypothetical protein
MTINQHAAINYWFLLEISWQIVVVLIFWGSSGWFTSCSGLVG